jgi:DNA-binding response OmpR family regulator
LICCAPLSDLFDAAGHHVSMRVLVAEDELRPADATEGLAPGADDYLAKPFRFAELVARIEALARRALPSRPPVLRHMDRSWRPAPILMVRG